MSNDEAQTSALRELGMLRSRSADRCGDRLPLCDAREARECLPPFFVQPQPPSFALLIIGLDIHADHGPDAREAVDHNGSRARSRRAGQVRLDGGFAGTPDGSRAQIKNFAHSSGIHAAVGPAQAFDRRITSVGSRQHGPNTLQSSTTAWMNLPDLYEPPRFRALFQDCSESSPSRAGRARGCTP